MASKVTITDLYAYEAGLTDGRAEQRAADIAALREAERVWIGGAETYCREGNFYATPADYLESLGVGPTEDVRRDVIPEGPTP